MIGACGWRFSSFPKSNTEPRGSNWRVKYSISRDVETGIFFFVRQDWLWRIFAFLSLLIRWETGYFLFYGSSHYVYGSPLYYTARSGVKTLGMMHVISLSDWTVPFLHRGLDLLLIFHPREWDKSTYTRIYYTTLHGWMEKKKMGLSIRTLVSRVLRAGKVAT